MTPRAIVYSAALHAILAVLLLLGGLPGSGKGDSDQDPGGNEKQGSIIPKTTSGEKSEPTTVEVALIFKKKPEPQPTASGISECNGDEWYGGIGITQPTPHIESVAFGYPAWRAGIKVGDKILSPDVVRGEPGSVLELEIDRDGQRLHFTIVREKICLDR